MSSSLPTFVVEQFHKAVMLAGPLLPVHETDVERFENVFELAAGLGFDLTGADIDAMWPADTKAGPGGDPAHSEVLKDKVYGLLSDWQQRNQNG